MKYIDDGNPANPVDIGKYLMMYGILSMNLYEIYQLEISTFW